MSTKSVTSPSTAHQQQVAPALPQLSGRPELSKNRGSIFIDPKWEERFDALIRLTQRTQLIIELTGLDLNPETVKHNINLRFKLSNESLSRPRGMVTDYNSTNFLGAYPKRLDAAYIYRLHYGATDPAMRAVEDLTLGAALDRLLTTYRRYVGDLYARQADARLSFEEYVIMIRGIQARQISVHRCGECSSRFVVTPNMRTCTCPVCAQLELNVRNSVRALDAAIARRKQALLGGSSRVVG